MKTPQFHSFLLRPSWPVVAYLRQGALALVLLSAAAWTAVSEAASPPDAANLLNLNFGVTERSGPAAVGTGPNDYWMSVATPGGVHGTWPNVKWANREPGPIQVTLENAPGVWGNATGDSMMDGYVYPWDHGNAVVRLSNLPEGQYDLYVYGAWGGVGKVNGNYRLLINGASEKAGQTILGETWTKLNWKETEHYVRFADLSVTAPGELILTAMPGDDVALFNGLQLLRVAPSPLPPCYTDDGVVDGRRQYTFTAACADDELRFDTAMRGLPGAPEKVRIRFQPYVRYRTDGSYKVAPDQWTPPETLAIRRGFQLKDGWEIQGNYATLQLARLNDYYNESNHPPGSITPLYFNTVLAGTNITSGLSISDLLVDCGLGTAFAGTVVNDPNRAWYRSTAIHIDGARRSTVTLKNIYVSNALSWRKPVLMVGTGYVETDFEPNPVISLFSNGPTDSGEPNFVVDACYVYQTLGVASRGIRVGGYQCVADVTRCYVALNGKDSDYGLEAGGSPWGEPTKRLRFLGNAVTGAGRGVSNDLEGNREVQISWNGFYGVTVGCYLAAATGGYVNGNYIFLRDKQAGDAYFHGILVLPHIASPAINPASGGAGFVIAGNHVFNGKNLQPSPYPSYGFLENFGISLGLNYQWYLPGQGTAFWSTANYVGGNRFYENAANTASGYSSANDWCNYVNAANNSIDAGNANVSATGVLSPGHGWQREDGLVNQPGFP